MKRRTFLSGAPAVIANAAGSVSCNSPSIAEPTPTPADLAGPWESPDAAIVLDPYHWNQYSIADLKLDPRIAGIVHKASEGATGSHGFFVDDQYSVRKSEALAAGYLWGSYHLGRPGDPEAQAQRYYELVRPPAAEVIALDLEREGGEMSMSEAALFIRRLQELTGRYPLLYGGRYTLSRPIASEDRELFAQCRLWIVDTRNTPRGWPTNIWPTYTLWQFSSELRYRYPIKSVDAKRPVSWDIDVNFFAGTREELRKSWPL